MVKNFRAREVSRNKGNIAKSQKPGKSPINTRCPKCDLLFQDGVWKRSVGGNSANANWRLCPACIQIRDRQVGGIVHFTGGFALNHRQELLNRIRNLEKQAEEERPLERIIRLTQENDAIMVLTTTEHLVARIGKAIQRDFGGNLELRYAPDDKFALAYWRRDY